MRVRSAVWQNVDSGGASHARRMTAIQAEAHPPKTTSLAKLRTAARNCTACPLYKNATQTVFGEGSSRARIMLVGEQPGDREDLTGHPFVGPAGALLDKALEEAGLDRAELYVTNTVKHFKNERVGKRRLHQKPSARDVAACRPWLEAEIAALKPEIIVALGATAAQALMGRDFRVLVSRGKIFTSTVAGAPECRLLATVHPSSILRAPDRDRDAQYRAFVADLKKIPRK